ncbi:MAG: hypothetical protein AB2A00_13955 [Myxococcota bacterium]
MDAFTLPRRCVWLLLAVATWSAGYFYTGGGASQQAHYGTARALVDHGTFRLDDYRFIDVDVARFEGHKLSNKPPGFPILMAPAALVGGVAGKLWPGREGTARQVGAYVTQLLLMGGLSFALLLMLALILSSWMAPAAAACVAALCFLGSYLWPFATTFFSHVGTAACGLLAVFIPWRARGRELSTREAALTGFALGYGPLIEYAAVVAFLPIGVWLLWHVRSWRERAALVGGALVPLLVLMAYQAYYFGSPFALSYAHLSTEHQVAGHAKGFLGASWPRKEELRELTFGTYRGLFSITPVTLVGAVGLGVLARRGEWAGYARAALLSAAAMLLFISGYWAWQGGSSFGPRLVLPMVPFLLVGVGVLWQRYAPVVVGVTVPAFFFMILGPAVCMIPHASHTPGYYNLVRFLGDKFLRGQVPAYADPIFGEHLLPPTERPTLGLAWNLGHVVGLQHEWTVVPFVVVMTALVVLLWREARRA